MEAYARKATLCAIGDDRFLKLREKSRWLRPFRQLSARMSLIPVVENSGDWNCDLQNLCHSMALLAETANSGTKFKFLKKSAADLRDSR